MSPLSLLPAFTDEATDSQVVFRHILTAMSEPGTIIDIEGAAVASNSRYSKNIRKNNLSCLWSVAQTLLDSDCSVFIYPSLNDSTFMQSLLFYTGVSFSSNIKDANFIFMSMKDLTDLNKFNLGTLEKPHLSSTALVYVEEVSSDEQILLSGPGIKAGKPLSLGGLSEEKTSLLKNNHKLYPCGIDFIFCTEKSMTAIPRSTKIKFKGNVSSKNIAEEK